MSDGHANPAPEEGAGGGTSGNNELINLLFKTSLDMKFELNLSPDLTVLQAKEEVAKVVNFPPAQQRLIHRGRILKDAETLKSYKILSGHTIHLVRGGAPAAPGTGSAAAAGTQPSGTTPADEAGQIPITPSTTTGAPTASPTASPVTAPGGPGTPGAMPPPGDLASLFAASMSQGNFVDPNLLAGGGGAAGFNPQMMQTLLQSPLMQGMIRDIMGNPDLIRSVLRSNPMLQQMSASNPMLQTMLANPELLSSMITPEILQQASAVQHALHQRQPPTSGGTVETPGAAADSGPTRATTPLGGAAPPPAGGPGSVGASPSAPGSFDGASMGPMMEELLRNRELFAAMQNLPLQDMMSRVLMGGAGGLGGASDANVPLDVLRTRFAVQLEQLEAMGFIDKDANLIALRDNNGDVDAAISWLLDHGHGG